MTTKIKKVIENYIEKITNEETSQKAQSETVFMLFAIIAAVMSVVNIITKRETLLIATAVFAFLCLLDYIMIKLSKRTINAANIIFATEVVILFTYFVITGGTDNFSTIWLLLLPALGLFFFGVKFGSVVCAVMLAIMLACFNIPALVEITTNYTPTFRMRFPLVYLACFFVSLFLETIRRNMMRRLSLAREKFSFLYNHDYLTGAKNRYTADEDYKKICSDASGNIGVAMFDIDFFRNVNTKLGHAGGDYVLVNIVNTIEQSLPKGANVYRWGGEEFLVFFPEGDKSEKFCQDIRKNVEDFKFSFNGENLNLTISGGLYIIQANDAFLRGFHPVLEKADMSLYEAKETGRNKIVTKYASDDFRSKFDAKV